MKTWSAWVPLEELVPGKAPATWFVTLVAGPRNVAVGKGLYGGRELEGGASRVVLEVELRHGKRVVKKLSTEADSGSTAGIVLPFHLLDDGVVGPSFLAGVVSLLDHVSARRAFIAALPYADHQMPKQYSVVTALRGYGEGHFRGIRHSSADVHEAEARSLRMLGFNGVQGAVSLLGEQQVAGSGLGLEFARGLYSHVPGYPFGPLPKGDDRSKKGCAYHPAVDAALQENIERILAEARSSRVERFLGITADEIGPFANKAPEGKAHLSTCEHCREGFRDYLRDQGVVPKTLGESRWSDIAPLDIWGAAKPEPGAPAPIWMKDRGAAANAYWTRRFNNYASARLFTPLRQAVRAANHERKPGEPEILVAAMKGNTFLMRGQSLDFFNWYRHADTMFLYETSNRDRRVAQWDSYLLDVGRTVSAEQELELGVLVKPHRGAGLQRAFSAVARGATWINWYTYGPEYAKGDSWSGRPDIVAEVQEANATIAAVEEVTYGSHWTEAPRVAIVKPRASEFWMSLSGRDDLWAASWENAKWMYSAISHAHVPLDPIDQVAIREGVLDRYDVLVINGPAFENEAMEEVEAWVLKGGTLITTGWGLARDEYNQPRDPSFLGLKRREVPELWMRVALYKAGKLKPLEVITPGTTSIEVDGDSVPIRIGRERLEPTRGTEVKARFADGTAAITQRTQGRGKVIVSGFFPGLEYAAPLFEEGWDMGTDLTPGARSLATWGLQDVKPWVDASVPTVEGVLVQNPGTKKRALILMNWGHRRVTDDQRPEVLETGMLEVSVRGAPTKRAVDSLTGRIHAVRPTPDGFVVELDELGSGAILLLD